MFSRNNFPQGRVSIGSRAIAPGATLEDPQLASWGELWVDQRFLRQASVDLFLEGRTGRALEGEQVRQVFLARQEEHPPAQAS